MFFFALFLLLVTAYFLFHAYQDWQGANNREGAYQRAATGTGSNTGKPQSQSVKDGSDSARSGSGHTSRNDSNRDKSKGKSGITSGGQQSGSANQNNNRGGSAATNNNKNRQSASGSTARSSGSGQSTAGNQKSYGSGSGNKGGSNQSGGSAAQSSGSGQSSAGNQKSYDSGSSNKGGSNQSGGSAAQSSGSGQSSAGNQKSYDSGSSNKGGSNRSGGSAAQSSGSGQSSAGNQKSYGSGSSNKGGSNQSAGSASAGSTGSNQSGAGSVNRSAGQAGSTNGASANAGSWAAGSVAAGAAGAAAYATRSSGSTGGKKASKETLRFSNREANADDLTRINGIGPVIHKDLNEMGVYNFSQIANFSQEDIDNVNVACDFPGRIERDEWIPQARGLMQGGAGQAGANKSAQASGAVTRDTLRFSNREAQADDLQRIKGIGPVLEKDLNDIGVYNFSQIANFSQAEIDNVNTAFDFPGRIERDEWIPQARKLQNGGGQSGSVGRGAAAAGVAAAGAAAAGGAAAHSSGQKSRYDIDGVADNASAEDFSNEIAERIKVLNLRDSDSPRLAVNKQEFNELAKAKHGGLDRGRLLDVAKILRWLCNEKI